jgi:hypothetical protein
MGQCLCADRGADQLSSVPRRRDRGSCRLDHEAGHQALLPEDDGLDVVVRRGGSRGLRHSFITTPTLGPTLAHRAASQLVHQRAADLLRLLGMRDWTGDAERLDFSCTVFISDS